MPKGTHGTKRGEGGSRPVCRGRIWIDGSEGTFLGYGRVVLLERIRDHGSISQAARSMEMSYRHAWELVDSMNRQAPEPLVEAVTGGKCGGGARLTAAGERAIEVFRQFYEDFQAFLDEYDRKVGFRRAKSSGGAEIKHTELTGSDTVKMRRKGGRS